MVSRRQSKPKAIAGSFNVVKNCWRLVRHGTEGRRERGAFLICTCKRLGVLRFRRILLAKGIPEVEQIVVASFESSANGRQALIPGPSFLLLKPQGMDLRREAETGTVWYVQGSSGSALRGWPKQKD